MSTLRQAIRAKLEATTALAALATGGIWDHDKIEAAGLGRDGITTTVVAAADSVIVRPSIYVKEGVNVPIYPVKANGKEAGIEIYFYDQMDYEIIAQMKGLVHDALHEQRVTFTQPSGWYCREIVFAADVVTEWKDDTMAGACMAMSRYRAYIIKLAEGY